MTGASRDPGTSANFRYTTSTDMTILTTRARYGPPAGRLTWTYAARVAAAARRRYPD